MNEDPKKRQKRILAIICLVFIVAGFGFMVAGLIAKGDISKTLNLIAVGCYAVGITLFAVLYFSGAFPQKQEKEREKRELEAQYYNKLAEDQAEQEQKQEQNGQEMQNAERTVQNDGREEKK